MAEEILEEMEEGEGRGLFTALLLLLILIVFIGIYMFYTSENGQNLLSRPSPTPSEQFSDRDRESPVVIGDNAINASASAQGNIVNVGFAILEEPGYVVIHADDDGQPGAVIGNSELLPSGETESFEVEVSRELVDGEVIYAMLHDDDGDRKYEFPGDDGPVISDTGNPFMMRVVVGDGEMGSQGFESL